MFICLHCGHEFAEPHNRYNKRWSDSDDSEPTCPRRDWLWGKLGLALVGRAMISKILI